MTMRLKDTTVESSATTHLASGRSCGVRMAVPLVHHGPRAYFRACDVCRVPSAAATRHARERGASPVRGGVDTAGARRR